MSRQKHFIALSAALLLAVALTACNGDDDGGGGATATTTDGGTPVATDEPTELQPFGFGGFSASAIGAWDYMAVRQGFYAEEGLDVEVTEAGSSDLLRALVAGRLDLAQMSVGTALSAIAEGAEITAIGVSGNIGDAMFAANSIESIEDLAGQDVLVGGTVGGLPYEITLAILRKHGLDENDVNLQVTGIADRERVTALLAGETVFTIAGIEHAEDVDASDVAYTFGLVKDELGGIPGTLLWVRTESLEDPAERAKIVAGVTAHVRGVRYAYENPDDTVEYLKELVASEDDDLMRRTVDLFTEINRVDPNISLSPELMQVTLDFFGHDFDVDDVADFEVREEVLTELGTFGG